MTSHLLLLHSSLSHLLLLSIFLAPPPELLSTVSTDSTAISIQRLGAPAVNKELKWKLEGVKARLESCRTERMGIGKDKLYKQEHGLRWRIFAWYGVCELHKKDQK